MEYSLAIAQLLMVNDVPLLALTYSRADYDSWVSGFRDKWVSGPVPAQVVNQPTYHFAEYFVLAYFRSLGWQGHRFYALGSWEPHNPKISAGRADIKRLFPTETLQKFNQARELVGRSDGKGEPDLFLFREDGATMFVEVKKDRDKLAPEQIECLQQIRSLLNSNVCVVHLVRGADSSE